MWLNIKLFPLPAELQNFWENAISAATMNSKKLNSVKFIESEKWIIDLEC